MIEKLAEANKTKNRCNVRAVDCSENASIPKYAVSAHNLYSPKHTSTATPKKRKQMSMPTTLQTIKPRQTRSTNSSPRNSMTTRPKRNEKPSVMKWPQHSTRQSPMKVSAALALDWEAGRGCDPLGHQRQTRHRQILALAPIHLGA